MSRHRVNIMVIECSYICRVKITVDGIQPPTYLFVNELLEVSQLSLVLDHIRLNMKELTLNRSRALTETLCSRKSWTHRVVMGCLLFS
jgi:hypothetical protein